LKVVRSKPFSTKSSRAARTSAARVWRFLRSRLFSVCPPVLIAIRGKVPGCLSAKHGLVVTGGVVVSSDAPGLSASDVQEVEARRRLADREHEVAVANGRMASHARLVIPVSDDLARSHRDPLAVEVLQVFRRQRWTGRTCRLGGLDAHTRLLPVLWYL